MWKTHFAITYLYILTHNLLICILIHSGKNIYHRKLSLITELLFPTENHKTEGLFQFRFYLNQSSHTLLSPPITTSISFDTHFKNEYKGRLGTGSNQYCLLYLTYS